MPLYRSRASLLLYPETLLLMRQAFACRYRAEYIHHAQE